MTVSDRIAHVYVPMLFPKKIAPPALISGLLPISNPLSNCEFKLLPIFFPILTFLSKDVEPDTTNEPDTANEPLTLSELDIIKPFGKF